MILSLSLASVAAAKSASRDRIKILGDGVVAEVTRIGDLLRVAIMEPARYAGLYDVPVSDLESGAVCIAPPESLAVSDADGDGVVDPGDMVSATSGIWLYAVEAGAPSFTWSYTTLLGDPLNGSTPRDPAFTVPAGARYDGLYVATVAEAVGGVRKRSPRTPVVPKSAAPVVRFNGVGDDGSMASGSIPFSTLWGFTDSFRKLQIVGSARRHASLSANAFVYNDGGCLLRNRASDGLIQPTFGVRDGSGVSYNSGWSVTPATLPDPTTGGWFVFVITYDYDRTTDWHVRLDLFGGPYGSGATVKGFRTSGIGGADWGVRPTFATFGGGSAGGDMPMDTDLFAIFERQAADPATLAAAYFDANNGWRARIPSETAASPSPQGVVTRDGVTYTPKVFMRGSKSEFRKNSAPGGALTFGSATVIVDMLS